jgi:hypothetical protein
MSIGLHVNYLLFLPDFNENWIISTVFFRKYSNIKFHEIFPLAAELTHADRWKDSHDETNSRFSQFCEGIKIVKYITYTILENEISVCICCVMRKTGEWLKPLNHRAKNTSKNKTHKQIYKECQTIRQKNANNLIFKGVVMTERW